MSSQTQENNSEKRYEKRWKITVGYPLINLILLSIIIWTITRLSVSKEGILALISLASFLSGSSIGFIFGLPCVVSETSSIYRNMYGDNSNLDQISDWLVKILVGVGLTQLLMIPTALTRYVEFVKPALGNSPSSSVVGVLSLIIFSVGGFIGGYLWTRRCAATMFMEGIWEQHEIEHEMDKDKEDIKKNTQEVVFENRKIIESIQNNQEILRKWETKVSKLIDLLEENQGKCRTVLKEKNPSNKAITDLMNPADRKKSSKQEKKIDSRAEGEAKTKEEACGIQPDQENKGDKKSKENKIFGLQRKMEMNKEDIKKFTESLVAENKVKMEKIRDNQENFFDWMEKVEESLEAITENQKIINYFFIEACNESEI